MGTYIVDNTLKLLYIGLHYTKNDSTVLILFYSWIAYYLCLLTL